VDDAAKIHSKNLLISVIFTPDPYSTPHNFTIFTPDHVFNLKYDSFPRAFQKLINSQMRRKKCIFTCPYLQQKGRHLYSFWCKIGREITGTVLFQASYNFHPLWRFLDFKSHFRNSLICRSGPIFKPLGISILFFLCVPCTHRGNTVCWVYTWQRMIHGEVFSDGHQPDWIQDSNLFFHVFISDIQRVKSSPGNYNYTGFFIQDWHTQRMGEALESPSMFHWSSSTTSNQWEPKHYGTWSLLCGKLLQ